MAASAWRQALGAFAVAAGMIAIVGVFVVAGQEFEVAWVGTVSGAATTTVSNPATLEPSRPTAASRGSVTRTSTPAMQSTPTTPPETVTAIPGQSTPTSQPSEKQTKGPASQPPSKRPTSTGHTPVTMTEGLFVDPESQPAQWVRSHPDDSRAAPISAGIATRPMARWFNGARNDPAAADAYTSAAASAHALPVLVAYNISDRDCGGGESSGGAASPAAYRDWVQGLAQAIGDRPAIVILEPDALPGLDCLSSAGQSRRLALLADAVEEFATWSPNSWVYLDAGHPGWVSAAGIADRLTAAGVGQARGFALNVSNYTSTEANIDYGQAVRDQLAKSGLDASYVIDTSRNGRPSAGDEWCNPPGQRVGQLPRAGGGPALDLQLWVKIPGESDGDCGIGRGTYAGEFSPDLALDLLGS